MMKNYSKLLMLLIPVFYMQVSLAQTTVTGTVTSGEDDSELPGVNVIVKGTTQGTVTDVNGAYSLEVDGTESVLVFSSVGFVSEEVAVGNQVTIDMVLNPDITALEEIVVVGYGTVKKSDLTGAVGSVETEQMQNQVLTGIEQGLRGQVAGVHVSQQSGAPGRGLNVTIRGVSTLSASSAPLYVIDGVPVAYGLDQINPNEIESIEILKDASSTAIYGSRGANGVVMITTKSGKGKGAFGVDVSAYFGQARAARTLDVANGPQYAELMNERSANDGGQPIYTDQEIASMPTYDWQDLVLQDAPVQNYDLSVFGSSDKTSYNIMMNYFDQAGIIKASAFQRGSLRLNLSSDISKKFNISTNLMIGRARRDMVPDGGEGGGLLPALTTLPMMSPRNEDGEYNLTQELYPETANLVGNPLMAIENNDNFETTTRILGNVSLRYNFIEDLSLTVLLGVDNETREYNFYSPSVVLGSNGVARVDKGFNYFYTNQNILNYKKEFNDHSLDVTGLFEWTTFETNSLRTSGSGFFTDALRYHLLDLAESQNPASTAQGTESQIASFMGRINYAFRGKYLITGAVRADGSSKFGSGNKWGTFPSAAIAWRISDEDFMQNNGVFSNLKLRVSWGQTGNQNFPSFQSLATYGTLLTNNGETQTVALQPNNLPNEELKWETTVSSNIGLDFGFIDDRLMFSAEYYTKKTEDLLAYVPLPPSVGFGSIIQNIGNIENKGFEFTADALIFDGDFRWGLNANFSYNKNKVLELAGGSDIIGDALPKPMGQMHIIREGLPLGSFWAHRESGYDETGAITYVDTNDDGVINDEDKVIQGDPWPDFFYGMTNNFSWKNFDLSIFIQGVEGADVINASKFFGIEGMYRGRNVPIEYYNDHWMMDGSNPDPAHGGLFVSKSNTGNGSERFIEDASYLRIKNVRLTYNIPSTNISWLRNASVFVSGDNLLTITDYSWYDPEASIYNGGNVTNRMRAGVDMGNYPTARTYIVGFKLGF